MADSLGSTPTLPAELPVLALRGTVLFPLTVQPLPAYRPVHARIRPYPEPLPGEGHTG